MEVKKAEFVMSSPDVKKCPAPDRHEYAFIGRSNVGKSSLINMLANRKDLAKTAAKPGKTQLINHFLMNGEWYMVDLPGYGYAKISRETAAKWMKMIERYIETSQALRVVFLLIDIRHMPAKKDVETYRMLFEKGFNPLIIATKADKISRHAKEKQIAAIRRELGLAPETPVIPFSSVTKEGKHEIWEYIDYFIEEIPV